MGEVYLALDQDVGDLVALKLMLSTTALSRGATERFRREVRLARRITHRNVARVHDLGQHEGTLYFTMEYVEGQSLRDVVGAVDLPGALEIAIQICAGLGAAHDAGVIHRDLKPANVLISPSGRVVLTDFGIARALEDADSATRTGGIIGTPLYMSPEQLEGRDAGSAGDIYALGLILYELVVGRVPFEGTSPISIAMARLGSAPPDPRAHASLPDPLALLTMRCLSADPNERPSTALSLEAALTGVLTEVLGTSGIEVDATAVVATAARPPKRADIAIAVLPFKYRGPSEHDYLGHALQSELIDILARTKGLKVLASGATARYGDDRDPAVIGTALRSDAVVDCDVRVVNQVLRVNARLIEVQTGVQTWSEKFDSDFRDVLEVEERLGSRIAEALRVGLATTAHRGEAPPEAIELYLRARTQMNPRLVNFEGESGAIALLERAIRLAPAFRPAKGALALAAVRAAFAPLVATNRDYDTLIQVALPAALEDADGLSDTHLAAATFATHQGRFADAVISLTRALELAPTCSEAHEYLGRLQCEAGRASEGISRLRLALDLNPSLYACHFEIARVLAMRGDSEAAAQHIASLEAGLSESHVIVLQGKLRLAVWRGDREQVLRISSTLAESDSPPLVALATSARAFLRLTTWVEHRRQAQAILASIQNRRFQSAIRQFVSEVSCAIGDADFAMECISTAADDMLVDLEWLDRCPVLEPVRSRDEFEVARSRVRRRAEAIWRV